MSNKQLNTQKSKKSQSASRAPKGNAKNNKNNSRTMSRPATVSIAVSAKATKRQPVIRNSKDGCIISNSELIGPVFKPATQAGYADVPDLYTVYRLRCNPGSQATFSWLAGQAVHWEYYRFRKLRFYYETRSASTTPGSIVMSPDYDAADGQVAVTEQALFANKGSVDDSVWKHISLTLSNQAMNRLYKSHAVMSDTRFAATKQDIKTIDVAQLFVCIDSADASAFKFGKLFVEYEVEFFEPQQVTEPTNLGGFSFIQQSPFVSPNSQQPLSIGSNVGNYKIDNNIITPSVSLPEITGYPTACVGRFARDFSGTVNLGSRGTGISGIPSLYVGTDPNTTAGSAGDINQSGSQLLSAINAAGTVSAVTYKVAALAGQYLKFKTGASTSLSEIEMIMSGLSALNLI